jgi:hypothetical protein
MWQEYYKLPLKVDEYCDIITWTADCQRAFDWLIDCDLEKKQELIKIINGEASDKKFKHKFYREGIHIFNEASITEYPILRVRGWGYLTGIGGRHLDRDVAIQIQNAFGDFIVEQLNKNVL